MTQLETSHPPKRIALTFPYTLAHLHHLVAGITRYARTHGQWSFLTHPETPQVDLKVLRNWDGDGVIASITNQEQAEVARDLHIPVISISSAIDAPGVPRAVVNNQAIGQLAAEHLLTCGFSRFAYYGIESVAYSRDRLGGFQETLGDKPLHTLHAPSVYDQTTLWRDEVQQLGEWLAAITPPFGLFVVNDARARIAVEACRVAGLSIPDQVAILGVDNDEVMTVFSDPPLSSIQCNRENIGYEAARLLDQTMSGDQAVGDSVLMPTTVIKRESTDIGVFQNEYLTQAHQYIRNHIHQPFGVQEIADSLGISRRRLEQCTQESLNLTPHQLIIQLRVEHAQRLLRDEFGNLTQVAHASGFRDTRRLRQAFISATGEPPRKKTPPKK